MRILQVLMNMDQASGVVTFVRRLNCGLRAEGVESNILTEADLLPECIEADVVHIHGLWRPHFHRMALKAMYQEVPVVWSPHGMLAPWSLKHKWLKKKIAWWCYQRGDLKSADAIHVTSKQEETWVRNLGFRQPMIIAPLGTDLPDLTRRGDGLDCADCVDSSFDGSTRTLLFVGRIYPVKAIDRLIEAFARVPYDLRCGWRFRIVGPEEDTVYAAQLRAQIDHMGLKNSVLLAGPKFGSDLTREYADCAALALVSHTENFGATIVDAMGYAKPVITGTRTPWREVVERKCGWWIDNHPMTLAKAIGEMMQLSDDQRREMGQRGRALVEARYTWNAVCRAMISAYQSVMHAPR